MLKRYYKGLEGTDEACQPDYLKKDFFDMDLLQFQVPFLLAAVEPKHTRASVALGGTHSQAAAWRRGNLRKSSERHSAALAVRYIVNRIRLSRADVPGWSIDGTSTADL